jgi:glycosyltransferase involved in cell wall biosynthesis
VNIRAYHLLRLLAEEFDVTALCFYRRSTRLASQIDHSVERLSEIAHTEAFEIPQEHSRARLVWDHLRSVAARRVYTVYAYESAPFLGRLREIVRARQVDIVHADSLDLSGYLSHLPEVPVVVDHHNVESALLRRRATTEPALRRRYLELQADLMEREERRWCGKVDLNLTCSPQDRGELLRLVPDARVTVVPNGVDTTSFDPGRGERSGICFVGGHTWFPNKDGMEYFAESILPLVRERRPDVRVRWIGRAPAEVMERYRDRYGIELTGYVDDIRPYVQGAACFIVPLRVGGGTRLKILDAWAMGKAVVSTSAGAEGLATEDGRNILVRDTPESFAEAVDLVLEDAELRDRLGAAARRTAEEVYDWRVIGKRMLSEYRTLLDGRD